MLKIASIVAAVALLGGATPVLAQYGATRHHIHRVSTGVDRPLTIRPHEHAGIYREGNDIIAPGGFSAHGYGYPQATPEERREADNARIRDNATGLYGYGVDGLGGTGFEDDPETGYNNPYWGNAFNSYTGYNGVPSILAFGPGYANRYAADHDPADDDEQPGPTPGQLGYLPQPGNDE